MAPKPVADTAAADHLADRPFTGATRRLKGLATMLEKVSRFLLESLQRALCSTVAFQG